MRIYSPAKRALDHDPESDCVRRWVPEFGTPAYPAPIVDARTALSFVKERLYGSRESGLPNTTHRPARKPVLRTASPAGNRGHGELF